MSTAFHAKFFAHALSQHYHGDLLGKISHSLFDARVDLNPHQLEAALFAMRSPLSKGVILADEVGLGKTIEAGLVLCQYWAERRRRLLIISPAALRVQWSQELTEKFHLPNQVIDARTMRQVQREGRTNPFDQPLVVITSIHFASRHGALLRTIPWDLVVIDEAHKLRNVFHQGNKMAQEINWALEERQKLLLTATPLQNSLMELYGLATLIDPHIFGEAAAFRARFEGPKPDHEELRERLASFCKRTLRSQVSEYIQYTERRAITLPFTPGEAEQQLYEAISAYLDREDTLAVPARQRHLLSLLLRKLLASSAYAISFTLTAMRNRLELMQRGQQPDTGFIDGLIAGEELESDYLEESEWGEGEEGEGEADPVRLAEEIRLLDSFILAAGAIGLESKAERLSQALETGFAEMKKMGAPEKALIFTESRRTQEYIHRHLRRIGYTGEIVLFNGSNTDPESVAIYQAWLEHGAASGRSSGSRQIDIRTALVDHFRDQARIMIATEAAAEGLNLQFCSLVINYDLPWNPQRIEQRIGRCHRYGQKHDVVVINFLNTQNQADQRVYELLEHKFELFNGVFGASDEILGQIESGVDFEARILDLYQHCRSREEIDAAFSALQQEMEESITHRLDKTRRLLLEHFDQDVQARLRMRLDDARQQLNRIGLFFWELTRYQLADQAQFNEAGLHFDLVQSPLEQVPPGRYALVSRSRQPVADEALYRLSHPLGEYVIAAGQRHPTPAAHLFFDISHHPTRISMIESLKGRSGWLSLLLLRIQALEREDHLIFAAMDDQGRSLDGEVCEHLFYCQGAVRPVQPAPEATLKKLAKESEKQIKALTQRSLDWNNALFYEECDRLDTWSEEAAGAVESELNAVKKEIRQLSRLSRRSTAAVEQHQIHRQLQELEQKKRRLRQRIFQVEDEIGVRRDALIGMLEQRVAQKSEVTDLFTIRWSVI
ncbi:MAG TPA: SNF2-related protein [bacterium]|nr:SNF2-related protein [bacterium]